MSIQPVKKSLGGPYLVAQVTPDDLAADLYDTVPFKVSEFLWPVVLTPRQIAIANQRRYAQLKSRIHSSGNQNIQEALQNLESGSFDLGTRSVSYTYKLNTLHKMHNIVQESSDSFNDMLLLEDDQEIQREAARRRQEIYAYAAQGLRSQATPGGIRISP